MTAKAQVVTSIDELRERLSVARREAKAIGLVPTMGALHAGHLALIARARRASDLVAVSIFVNPTQFGANEDFASYPRDLDRDVGLAASSGAELIFAPSVAEMYPDGEAAVVVDPGPISQVLEGASRPGHFRGVATVVTKLFALFMADRAFFGEKDYQQLLVVRGLARDLSFVTEVVGVETVREDDGLALSSRNARLDIAQRAIAPALHRALLEGKHLVESGSSPEVVEEAMRNRIAADEAFELDYAVCRDASNLAAVGPDSRALRLLIAARLGPVRLIDNLGAAR